MTELSQWSTSKVCETEGLRTSLKAKRSKLPQELFKGLQVPMSHFSGQCSVAYSCLHNREQHDWFCLETKQGNLSHQVSQDLEGLSVDAKTSPGTGSSRSPYSFQGDNSRACAAVSRPAQAFCLSTAIHSPVVMICPFCFLAQNLKIYLYLLCTALQCLSLLSCTLHRLLAL